MSNKNLTEAREILVTHTDLSTLFIKICDFVFCSVCYFLFKSADDHYTVFSKKSGYVIVYFEARLSIVINYVYFDKTTDCLRSINEPKNVTTNVG